MSTARINVKAAELNALAAAADGLQKRYTAHLMLYDAACMADGKEEIIQRREECHTLLDGILDNSKAIHFCTRELQKLVQGS